MNTAKSHKILVLLTAFVLSLIAAVCTLSFSSVKAASTASDPDSYFGGSASLSFKDGNLVAEMIEDNSFAFYNRLVVEDLKIELKVPIGIEEFSISLKSDAYYANGNPVVNGSKTNYVKEVENLFTVKLTDSATEYSINGNTGVRTSSIVANDGAREFTVAFSVTDDHLLEAKIDGFNSVFANKTEDAIERIDKTTALVSFKLDKVVAGADGVQALEIISVDQKASDESGAYKQTFETDEDGVLTDTAYPRVALNDSVFIKDPETGKYDKLTIIANVEKSYTVSVYSVLGDTKTSEVWLAAGDEADDEKLKKVSFGKEGSTSFDVVFEVGDEVVVLDTYSVTVINKQTDKAAPEYIGDAQALKAYKDALDAVVYQEILDGNTLKKVSISLGTSAELPSMRDLVYDEYTPYESLSVTVNYASNDNQSQTSADMSFKITKAGGYEYYVIFTDNAGNSMEADYFRKQDEEDENKYIYGTYKDYIFKFSVEDNAPITIEKSNAEGVGYKGIEYKASKFNVEAEGCKTTYTLYYNAKVDAEKDDEGWITIPAASKVTSETYTDEDGNTYDSVQAVGYDGLLTFTPTEYGSYMIECVATSDYTTRTDSDYSILRVDKKTSTPSYVEVPSYWLRDNIWSVIFLSVGTLSLIGIIILLFIKPKDETESD